MNSDQLNARIPYATPDELEIIRVISRSLEPQHHIVIIGAGPGVMLLAAREGNQRAPITLIDINTCRYAQVHLEQSGQYEGRTQYVIADSGVFGAAFWSEQVPVHLLIVDGDHTLNGVRRDLDAWLSYIPIGGYIFLHDFNADDTQFAEVERYPGVQQAVLESVLMTDAWVSLGRYGTALVLKRAL